MYERLNSILQQKCFLHARKKALVGFSGGPDSLTLLDIMLRAGYAVTAAHYNHTLRPEADEDERQAGEIAARLGAEFVSGRGDVRLYASQHGLSLEAAGRKLRYAFLFEKARQMGAEAVAVGHTADDQVETLLLHLLHGAGLDGLKGMPWRLLPNPWDADIPLLRPLLSTWREEILAYCRERGLQPLMDATNRDVAFARNRVRLELLPNLELYNPEVKQALWRLSQALQGDAEIVQEAVEAAWQRVCMETGPGYVGLDRQSLLEESQGMQGRLLKKAAAFLLDDLREFDFEAVERGLAFARNPAHSRPVDLAAGLRLQVEGDRLWLASWAQDLPEEGWPQAPTGPFLLPIPGQLELGQGWILTAEWGDLSPGDYETAYHNPDPWQAWLDLEGLDEPLTVRRRKPGDQIRPLGMGGRSLKVSDLMINCKLPSRARPAWPLVCTGEEIAWVPGLRLAHDYRLQPGSTRVVQLALKKDS